MAWNMYLFGLNPECQEKAREEVRAVFANKDSDEITWLDASY